MKNQKFKLLHYFSLTSLFVFVLVAFLLVQPYHKALLRQLIDFGGSEHTERITFGSILTIFTLLYLVLFFIIRRADSLIAKQSDKLRKLSQAVEQSPNSVIITDVEGNIEYVNPKFTETTGYTLKDVAGNNSNLSWQNEKQDGVFWEAISSGEAWHGEFYRTGKDQMTYWEYATISPMYDEQGHLSHFIELRQDITERKLAEEALRKSQRQLEHLLERETKRRHLSETLRKVAKIVSSSLEQEGVVDLILGQLEHVITYHRATVSILEGAQFRLIAGRDKMGGEIDSYSFPADKYPVNAQVLIQRQPVLIPDVTDDDRWHTTQTMHGIRSFISAPLLVQDYPIGTLAVGRVDELLYTEEDAQTVFAFATQVAIAIKNAQLHEELRNRMRQELYMAQQIQKSLLAFELPKISGLDIAGYSKPAREVGGDFYNFSVFDENCLGFAVGDVTGKGMQAALMMSLSFGLLATEARHAITPASLMTTMNQELLSHTQQSHKMNTAVGYVTLDRTGSAVNGQWHLRAANAGLIAPLIRRKNGEIEWLDVSGLPLGTVEGLEYNDLEQHVSSGDFILLTSDGIVEAMNDSGEMYGFDRLMESVASADCCNAKSMMNRVLDNINRFVDNAEVHDDLTMVVVGVQ
ncbi:hypothetical protein CSA56_07185 [candidate division KSB3 bacterium]|uniref:PAS domain-containing protein n=1 Tax=candidate division KSB3 bacterium TaxID=2044937 RepID=A0A2G6KG20_9BACT|nr:MAG: hypothetical protein CSA56_07185 [candidate division KSB3 bacterium]